MTKNPYDKRDLPTEDGAKVFAVTAIMRSRGKWYDEEGGHWDPRSMDWDGWFPLVNRRAVRFRANTAGSAQVDDNIDELCQAIHGFGADGHCAVFSNDMLDALDALKVGDISGALVLLQQLHNSIYGE